MGMDYQFAGSASYPRFDREVASLVKLFGGIESNELKNRKDDIKAGSISWWFGYSSSFSSKTDRYLFPDETDATLVKWFNNLYSDKITVEETKHIRDVFDNHRSEVEKISDQIMYELDALANHSEAWHIS